MSKLKSARRAQLEPERPRVVAQTLYLHQPAFLGVRAAAARVGISRSLLFRLRAEGRITFRRLGGKNLVSVVELDTLIEGLPQEAA